MARLVARRASIVTVAALVATAALLVGCGGSAQSAAQTPGSETAASLPQASVDARTSAAPRPVVVISDRHGPSWRGVLGDAVQIDWYDQTTGKTTSELVAVLAVRRLPDPDDDGGPDEFGDSYGPYEWKYGIKVRLTSLDSRSAKQPLAYQFLQLSDGRTAVDGVSGLGLPGGPDPDEPGESSAGWLHQRADQGFKPTRVTMQIGAWRATWALH
jgi:hypothetical protein